MDDLSFTNGLACLCCIIYALIEPHIEALERLIGVEQLSQLDVFFCEVCDRYPRIVDVEVANELQSRDCGVSHECVLEGGDVGVLKRRQKLILDWVINVLTLIVLITLLHMLLDDVILVVGVCPLRDGGHLTGVGQADKWDWADEHILRYCQGYPKVGFMVSSAETLDPFPCFLVRRK